MFAETGEGASFAETGKGASQQAKRPRSGDPLHSTAPMEYELSQEVRPVGLIPRADSLKRQKQIDTAGAMNLQQRVSSTGHQGGVAPPPC